MTSRQKISVCIATFNGERFIAEQLISILRQLDTQDEVVIVDDASTDQTCNIVRSMNDARIRLFPSKLNRGVLRAFEKAISNARGEIVFLSDQDDIWLPTKVSSVLSTLEENPALMVVVSDALLIDREGNQIGDSYYKMRGSFTAGIWANIHVCKYLGCTMAFRSRLLGVALPFPKSTHVHHDIWLGCVNALVGGKTAYIAKPLVAYRRHEANVTGRIRFSTYKRFQMRWQLISALVGLYFGRLVRGASTFTFTD